MTREYKRALTYVERAIAADSDNVDAFVMKTRIQMVAGDWMGARETGRRVIQRFGAERSAGTQFFELVLPAFDTTDLVPLERVRLDAFAGNKVLYHFWRTHLFERWKPNLARAHADSMWRIGQHLVAEQPDNRIIRGGSGWTNSLLGNRERALTDMRRAVELAKATHDAFAFAETGQYAAYVYLRLGEYDAALDVLDQLLRAPSWLSAGWLKNDPLWAPLKTNPRFQQLLSAPPAQVS